MALTDSGFKLSVVLVDNGGNKATKTYDLIATTFTEAQTATTAILAALAGVTDAVVKSYFVGQSFKESALVLPGTGVQVENTAKITALIAGEVDKYATINIPAAKPAIFTGLSGKAANIVDPANIALGTYLDLAAEGEASYTVSDGEYIEPTSSSTVSGKRVHRGSTSG